jgi:RyR domain/ATPase family associated with various cellular activities (AAA)
MHNVSFDICEENKMSDSDKIVIVTGDVAMDWNLARARRCKRDLSFWSAADTTCTYWQRGGSALLADLVGPIAVELHRNGSAQFSLRQTAAPREPGIAHTDNPEYHHSYAMWSLFKYGEKAPLDQEKTAWRVEEFLGMDRARSDAVHEWQTVVDDTSDADLVILDDAGLGFRNHPELWPSALTAEDTHHPWILLKMASPLAQGPLWEHLHRNCSDRLIAVATVEDLRLTEVQVSRELSWERTAQDVFWELVHNPSINSLSHCAHVVISFGTAGAILISRQEADGHSKFKCSLFFDPQVMEGMWETHYPGGMIGYTTCLTASIARQLMRNPQKPDIDTGITAGLAAIRTLHKEGYGERGAPPSTAELTFPIAKVAATLAQKATQFTVASVQDPMRFMDKKGAETSLVDGYWTILHDWYKDTLETIATRVVREGPKIVLEGVPWGQFGDLLTVDRQEIESFRSISNLVFEYCRQEPQKRPLSVAVFGPPGSGKSFGIKEIAKSLLPGQIEVLEFNLSQFDSEKDLHDAFHQVRDMGLSGKIPLVFWDEFDTSLEGAQLGWLRYFLAPMQDGRFQEGQINHPIGRSIFVFAGGTSSTMTAFDQGPTEEFRAAKGPDFISRLKGYINVLGPNPVEGGGTSAAADPYFIIRRAILLHSSLKRNAKHLFEKSDGKELLSIDRGVLRALLKTSEYKHGVRSIESIIAMSQLTGETSFERSSLPAESQLDLHVDGKSFLSLVQQIELEGDMLEKLAEAAHDVFCEGLRERGYKYGPKTDEKLMTHVALVPYAKLPEQMKEQSRLNVRDIPVKLAVAGYIMIPARSNELSFSFPDEALVQLAEAEHERWMRSMLDGGWSYAPETDRDNKRHKLLIPWDELPEGEREKDRDLVRGVPDILARAGYAIVKSSV